MKKTMRPFSNGSEAMSWYAANCETCTKAFFPKQGKDYPCDATMKSYCSTGKECRLKYYLDFSFITGELPVRIAEQIGTTDYGLKQTCMMHSDDSNDGYRPKKRPQPDNTPDNQMVLPFAWNEIAQERIWQLEV